MIRLLLLAFAFVLFVAAAWKPELGSKFIPLGLALLTLTFIV